MTARSWWPTTAPSCSSPRGALHARAPASIKGLLEIRGVGIVKMPVRRSVKIALVVQAGQGRRRACPSRAFTIATRSRAPTQVPQIALDARFASTPAKIRAALWRLFRRALFRDTFNPK